MLYRIQFPATVQPNSKAGIEQLCVLSTDGLDFNATTQAVTLPASQKGGVACALFPVLTDSLGSEGVEQFGVTFDLEGPLDESGRVVVDGGRGRAVAGLQMATVSIQDSTGEEKRIKYS